MIYKDKFFDDIVEERAKKERQNGREEAVDSIRKASQGGSKLDRAPKEDSGKGRPGKSLDKLSQADIHDMSEEELASYEKEMDMNEAPEDIE